MYSSLLLKYSQSKYEVFEVKVVNFIVNNFFRLFVNTPRQLKLIAGVIAMFKLIRKLRKDEGGATAIEYGLIAALISVAAIVALQAVGGSLNTMFTSVSGKLDDADPGS